MSHDPSGLVCQTCGDKGFTNAFIYCVKCLQFVIHRYCLDVIPKTIDEFVPWFCEDCRLAGLPSKYDPSRFQKENPAIKIANVKTTKRKKKQKAKQSKKMKIVPSVAVGKVKVKQSSESKNQESAIPENEHLQSQKTDATNSAQLVTIKLKKKQKRKPKKKQIKKKKIISLVSRKEEAATKPNHESISPSNSPLLVNLDSEPKEKDAFQKQNSSDSAELDRKGRPLDKKRTSDATSVHSSCESSCTDVPRKNSVDEQEQGCEVKQVFNSSSIEKELNNTTMEIETENRMQQEQGAYASQSAYLENNVQYIHYQPARPIIDPLWRGSFNIIQTDYNVFEGLFGHLSSKACVRVRDEACTLPSLLCLEMQPKTALWPKSFLDSLPSDENIALYFLPGSTRNGRDFEQLVNDMIFEELAMKATSKNAELLIFTSKVLPESYWSFQGNYYLWGVFRRKKNDDHSLAASNTSDNRDPSNK